MTDMTSARSSVTVIIALLLWLLLALIAGASGLTARLVPPFPQAVLLGLVLVQLLMFAFCQRFRIWCMSVDLRALVLFHVTRFVGIYFLILYSRGMLPYIFAVPGGWGDIASAVYAVLIVTYAKPVGKTGWSLYLLWNLLGFADILFVVLTAARLAFSEPASMAELLKLPLALLPTFVVPVIIFTHLVIFARLYSAAKRGYGHI
jgi:hypothetical protein